MYNKFVELPVGWCFTPDDEQLIKLHLFPKVWGFPLMWDGFAEKDLYGVDAPPPWVMFSEMDSSVDDPPSAYYHTETNKEGTITRKTVYVFTKLKAAASAPAANSKKGVRVSRRGGGGTWSGKSKPKKIVDSVTGDIIGHTKQLAFEHGGVDEEVVGHWIMHEYSLTAGWGSDFVLCKITRCTTHPAPAPIDQEEEENHPAPAPIDQEEENHPAPAAIDEEEEEENHPAPAANDEEEEEEEENHPAPAPEPEPAAIDYDDYFDIDEILALLDD